MKYRCNVPLCESKIQSWQVMCSPHWKKIPKDVKTSVWREYRMKCRGIDREEFKTMVKLAIILALAEPEKKTADSIRAD